MGNRQVTHTIIGNSTFVNFSLMRVWAHDSERIDEPKKLVLLVL
jgi:hypothetical protein